MFANTAKRESILTITCALRAWPVLTVKTEPPNALLVSRDTFLRNSQVRVKLALLVNIAVLMAQVLAALAMLELSRLLVHQLRARDVLRGGTATPDKLRARSLLQVPTPLQISRDRAFVLEALFQIRLEPRHFQTVPSVQPVVIQNPRARRLALYVLVAPLLQAPAGAL